MPKESIIQHYSSATTGNVPAAVDLALGELAINTADERVFIKNNAGTVLSLSQTKDLSGAFAKTSATVSSVNGFTGAVQVTGSGAIVHSVSGTTTTLGARLATTGSSGVASFNAVHFSMGSTGHVSLATGYTVTGDTVQAGSGISINAQKVITNTGVLTLPLASAAGATGVASFRNTHFLVGGTGHVQLAAAYQVTGDTVQAGSGISINAQKVISNSGVLTFNGSSGTVTYAPPLASAAGATGVASFLNTHFTVDTTGHVKLASAYTVTGDTVQAGSFINIGTGKTINNIGVQTLNGFTGAVQVTGSGAILHSVSGTTTTLGARLATTGSSGVASFNATHFTMGSTGHVSLATGYTVTGDTVQAGSGISINAQKVITNTGVLTLPLATAAGATGVASFRNTHFLVDGTGHVQLAAAYQVTGDTVITVANSGIAISTVGNTDTLYNIGVLSLNGFTGAVQVTGSGAILHSVSGTTTTLGARLATTGSSGVASFNAVHFSMGSTGHVSLATAYTVTGDTVQAGTGITIGAGKTINNTGVLTFNGSSGTVTYAPPLATASVTGVASFRNTHFTIDTTGHVQLAAAYQVTGDTVITVANSGIAISTVGNTDTLFNIGVLSLNGLTGATTLTGDGGSSLVLGNNRTSNRIATTSLTGVASFLNTHFTVDTTGHVKLASAYTVTGDTVQAGSGISIGAGKTINNTGVLTFNGNSGTVGYAPPIATLSATGVASFDPVFFTTGTSGHIRLAAAYQATGSGIATVPLATTSLTGTASFNLNRFQVSGTGNVDLLAAFQVTGDTVVAGSFINFSQSGTSKTINNIGVQTLNGFTGAVQVTGSGAIVHSVSGTTTTLGARLTTAAGATGVASFRNNHFTVDTTGHVQLAAAYQVTGDTVQAGSGISINAQKVISNTGVLTFNGSSGTVGYAPPLATAAGATGVASFRNTHFTVDTTGHVQLATAYQVTGQTVVSGGASQLVSTSGNTVTIDNRIATASATGVASFLNTHFTVDTTGHVKLASAYTVTGDTVQAGSGISINAQKVISNSGVITFNGSSGTVTYAPPLATAAGATGVASFRNTHFLVDGTGHVQLAAAYQVTGDTVQAGSGISINAQKVITNTGVLTLPLASAAGATGVASFRNIDFVVDTTGHVSLTGTVAKTNVNNLFTAAQRFNSGLSGTSLFVGSSTTTGEFTSRELDDGIGGDVRVLIKSNHVNGLNLNSGGGTASSLILNNAGVHVGHNGVGGWSTLTIGANQINDTGFFGFTPNYTSRIVMRSMVGLDNLAAEIRMPSANNSITGTLAFRLPQDEGTFALTKNLVSAINGLTGAVQVTGSGAIVHSVSGTTTTLGARLASAAGATGVASFRNIDFVVDTTGHVSLTGTVAKTNVANTFTALQSFSTGLSASNGITFGSNVTINGNLNATTKSFVIPHPSKSGMTLRYGSLEGPENGVYVRGRLRGGNTIELPDYWTNLVDEESITVNLTPIGSSNQHYVIVASTTQIVVGSGDGNIDCYYMVLGERKDVPKLEVEY